jgi:RimJ/RimL family protein N-acetyltransferase
MKKSLLKSLLAKEIFYVEEIYRLCFLPSEISFIEDDSGENGWIFMPGEKNSADWNLARCKGKPEKAVKIVDSLPKVDLQLLIDRKNLDFVLPSYGFQKESRLLWFHSEKDNTDDKIKVAKIDSELKLEKKIDKKFHELFTAQCPAIYLLKDQSVIGYSKAVRESPNYIEVCIEMASAYRNMGIGTCLLANMVDFVHSLNKRLVYAVDETNLASQAIAAKNRLLPFNDIWRFSTKK